MGVCAAGPGLWSPCWPGWGSSSEPASHLVLWDRLKRVAAGGPLSMGASLGGGVPRDSGGSQGAGVELLSLFLFDGRIIAFQYRVGFCPAST